MRTMFSKILRPKNFSSGTHLTFWDRTIIPNVLHKMLLVYDSEHRTLYRSCKFQCVVYRWVRVCQSDPLVLCVCSVCHRAPAVPGGRLLFRQIQEEAVRGSLPAPPPPRCPLYTPPEPELTLPHASSLRM